MTIANRITILRIISIPFFIIALLEQHLGWARGIFLLSALTDALDGALARVRRERTQLGSFLDPMADKLLLVATYIAFTHLGWIPLWVFVAVVSRDLLIVLGWSVVYLLTHNARIQPRPLGKATTVLQMAFAVAKLFAFPERFAHALLVLMIAATLLSALDYVWAGNQRLSQIET